MSPTPPALPAWPRSRWPASSQRRSSESTGAVPKEGIDARKKSRRRTSDYRAALHQAYILGTSFFSQSGCYFHTGKCLEVPCIRKVQGYYQNQRKRNLPDEESGNGKIERPGNGTLGHSGNRMPGWNRGSFCGGCDNGRARESRREPAGPEEFRDDDAAIGLPNRIFEKSDCRRAMSRKSSRPFAFGASSIFEFLVLLFRQQKRYSAEANISRRFRSRGPAGPQKKSLRLSLPQSFLVG